MKLVLLLGWELAKYEILEKVMEEFVARGLDKVYTKEIKAWKKYKREKKFAIKLDEQMKGEIKRFKESIKGWKLKELEEIVWEISEGEVVNG